MSNFDITRFFHTFFDRSHIDLNLNKSCNEYKFWSASIWSEFTFFFAPEKGLLKILMLADATNKLEQKLHYFIMKLNLTMFGGKI